MSVERDISSAEQDQWVEITAAVRAQLAKYVEQMPAMNPGEVLSLISAIRDAMSNEVEAAIHDASKEAFRACRERLGRFD